MDGVGRVSRRSKELPTQPPAAAPEVKNASRPKKGLLAGFGGLLLIGLTAWVVLSVLKAVIHEVETATAPPKVATPSVPTLRFAAMGDMLAHDSVDAQAKTTDGYDFKPYFKNIRSLYTGADVVFCNQEGLVSGEEYGISGYPSFNGPSEFAEGLSKGAGCNMINLANNHIGDKGQAALDKTIDVWAAQKPLAMAGAYKTAEDQQQVAYFTKNDIKVAFLAFADFSNNTSVSSYGLNLYHNRTLVEGLMTEARKNADVVIVSAHWGTEDSTLVNQDQIDTAQLLNELGADVVIGTGPHVLQRTERLKSSSGHETFVWYSLGNMLSSQLTADELTGGVAGFEVTKTNGKIAIRNFTFKSTFMSYDWSASDRAAENLLARKNLQLRPLSTALSTDIQKMFPGETSKTRTEFVHTTLGSDAGVRITP